MVVAETVLEGDKYKTGLLVENAGERADADPESTAWRARVWALILARTAAMLPGLVDRVTPTCSASALKYIGRPCIETKIKIVIFAVITNLCIKQNISCIQS